MITGSDLNIIRTQDGNQSINCGVVASERNWVPDQNAQRGLTGLSLYRYTPTETDSSIELEMD